MPQFELDEVGPKQISGLVRGRSAQDAVQKCEGMPETAQVAITEKADVQGWMAVSVEGQASGRVRLHQRMKFRRD